MVLSAKWARSHSFASGHPTAPSFPRVADFIEPPINDALQSSSRSAAVFVFQIAIMACVLPCVLCSQYAEFALGRLGAQRRVWLQEIKFPRASVVKIGLPGFAHGTSESDAACRFKVGRKCGLSSRARNTFGKSIVLPRSTFNASCRAVNAASSLATCNSSPRARSTSSGLGVLAFGVQQFVNRFADDGNDGRLPFRPQSRSDQRLDVGDGEQPRVEPARSSRLLRPRSAANLASLRGQIMLPVERWFGSALRCSINWRSSDASERVARVFAPSIDSGIFPPPCCGRASTRNHSWVIRRFLPLVDFLLGPREWRGCLVVGCDEYIDVLRWLLDRGKGCVSAPSTLSKHVAMRMDVTHQRVVHVEKRNPSKRSMRDAFDI